MSLHRLWLFVFSLALLIPGAACQTSTPADLATPGGIWSAAQTEAALPLPGAPTDSYRFPALRAPGDPVLTPTPDAPHYQPAARSGPETYVVQAGDILSAIAMRYSVSVDALVGANDLPNPDALEVGQVLTIPVVDPQAVGPAFKIIPDSELVYGPMSRLDVRAFIQGKGGYLAGYSQEVDGEILDAAAVVERVAADYSVNPRLLLAVLEYRSGWVTNPNPDPSLGETPFGFNDGWYVGLYRQLVWAANNLNMGYYNWRYGGVSAWVLADGSVVPIAPTVNAGTAGVQHFFARLDGYDDWLRDVSPGGFFDTYYLLFGYPFDLAVEPLVPPGLVQPALLLPFSPGETWSFTGGPHASWDSGSPYGALDFAPPGEALGCVQSDAWLTAAADGLVTRTGEGLVVLDLDLDGLEQTGWVIIYMHVESRDRVRPGTLLRAGDRLGHPSCEGGISSGTHVHVARRFNGEWIPSGPPAPFTLSGWTASAPGEEYVGVLTRDGLRVESFEGNSTVNRIQR